MEHNDIVLRHYCRMVSRRLPLPAKQKKVLLHGLWNELRETAPDCTSLQALTAHAGTPAEAAQELLHSFSSEQIHCFRKQQHRRFVSFAAAVAALVLCASLIYCRWIVMNSVAYATEHITTLPTTNLSNTTP